MLSDKIEKEIKGIRADYVYHPDIQYALDILKNTTIPEVLKLEALNKEMLEALKALEATDVGNYKFFDEVRELIEKAEEAMKCI